MAAGPAHYVRRFFGSLFAGSVGPAELEWVEAQLTPEEWRLWQRMGRIDRVESVTVARRVAEHLPADLPEDHPWVAAALLHDIGKRDSGFGTFRRAAAQMMGTLAGRGVGRAWMESSGQMRRVGIYLEHAAIGATAIEVAGGRPEVAAWARVHHDPAAWSRAEIPARIGRVLATADGERVDDRVLLARTEPAR